MLEASQPQARPSQATSSPFIRKLRHAVHLTPDDEAIPASLSTVTRRVERGDVQRDGTEPRSIGDL